MAVAAIPDVF
jgi:methylthioribulose-1-phosphate dehydratase